MNIRETYQMYLDAPYYRRVVLGKECVQEIMSYMVSQFKQVKNSKGQEEDASLITLIGALRRFIGADGNFNQDEYEFLNDIFETNFDYDKMLKMLNNDFFRSYKTANTLGAMLDYAPDEVRYAFIRLGLLICVADGTLTVDEQRAIEKMR